MKTLKNIGLTVSAILLTNSLTLSAAPLKIKDIAPDFNVTTIAGKQVKLSELRGKKRFTLNFGQPGVVTVSLRYHTCKIFTISTVTKFK